MTDYIRITPEGHIRVTDAAPFDYIVSYVPFPDINKMVGDPIALPNTATITRKSGKVEMLIVNWEPVSTGVAGTFDISGSVGNGAGVVVQRVIVAQLTDLDILRQIRDANPTSQLPTLWLDSKDPYTDWVGLIWVGQRVQTLNITTRGVYQIPGVKKLSNMENLICTDNAISTLDVTNMPNLKSLVAYANSLSIVSLAGTDNLTNIELNRNVLRMLTLGGTSKLISIRLEYNQLIELPTLLNKGVIIAYWFRYNLFPTLELDRFRAMGFTDEFFLLPQNI